MVDKITNYNTNQCSSKPIGPTKDFMSGDNENCLIQSQHLKDQL